MAFYMCIQSIFTILQYFILKFYVYASMSAHYLCAGPKETRGRAPEPLKLELQTVVNYHVGDGNKIWVLSKSIRCS